jgi:dipeptidyl aminopeptidase/acylaminoacyl peptidase
MPHPLLPRPAAPAAALLLLLSAIPASPAQTATAPATARPANAANGADGADPAAAGVTLETIMADPDWIGNAPEKPYWADDGRTVYYEVKRQGSELRDLYRQRLDETAPHVVADSERGGAGAAGGEVSRDRKWKVYVRDGDVFLKNLASGAVRQLTRTPEPKKGAHFMADGKRVAFREKDTVLVYDIDSGLLSQPVDLRLAKDPGLEEPADFLKREQLKLFSAVREERDRKKEARERAETLQRSDPSRPPLPWYLGEKVKIDDVSLSPSGEWMLVVTRPKDAREGKQAVVPHWVTETGYVEPKEGRALVGTENGCGDSLILLDLRGHIRHDLDASLLPGIKDDPLKELRDAAIAQAKARAAAAAKTAKAGGGADAKPEADKEGAADAKPEKDGKDAKAGHGAGGGKDSASCGGGAATPGGPPAAPAVRPVRVVDAAWSQDGRHAAVELAATDHKDRWIATVDLDGARLVPRDRRTDPAWISWNNNVIGWLADNETLYFDSEASGWNHLYALDVRDGKIRQLTSGKFEVSSPEPSFDGRTIWYTANASHPGQYDVWRVAVATGRSEQLTHLGGLTGFWPSLDERQLLILHSSLAHHDELYVQANEPGAAARQITSTMSPAFLAHHWTIPDIVPIPSSHGAGAIYSRVYSPPAAAPGPAGHPPAVVFVDRAGYLQDAHAGWSYYFHEFMFHTFLTEHGYVVLDMDYRASAGYGRDWRTAIYRQMGHPELEDLADGVDWLVRNKGVDRGRVGVYGGSYGGFLTLMALFRTPDLFAAGAALRPVTDWSDYNDGYTGAILNTPEIDPEAYDRSSPIEFAAGLRKPLLICHGMVDDNVFFVDSARLVQRLIELEKEDFSIAPFPVESHAFHRASSWLDEYRRIWKLMSANLR